MSDEEKLDAKEAVIAVERKLEEKEEDLEAKAKELGGYMTKEEWIAKGRDPEEWRDPETFVKVGEKIKEINTTLKEKLEKEQKEREELKEELEAYKKTNDQVLEKVRKDAYEKAKDEYDRRLAEIKEERKEAFETLDYEKLEQAEAKIEQLKKPEEPKQETTQPAYVEPPKDFITWEKENKWWNEDEDLRAYAIGIAGQVQTELKLPDGIELYNAVTERVKRVFPDKFKNPKREEAPTVESETADETPKSNGKKFKDLPKSAKKAYETQRDKLKIQGIDFTKEEYAQFYFEQEV